MPCDSVDTNLANLNPIRYRGYYYDTESGFYYLQTRYYDPETCRFINADVYASTGQGILGYNMFAYCLNNPVNYYDPTGTLAYPGEIHNQVVRHISEKYQLNSEQKILYKSGGFGRADLISDDGHVWEVKRAKPSQIKAGKKQVKKYAENTWKRFPEIDLEVGKDIIAPDSFRYKSGLATYEVTYSYVGEGVIAYDYEMIDFDYETLAAVVLVATVVCLTIATGSALGALGALGALA